MGRRSPGRPSEPLIDSTRARRFLARYMAGESMATMAAEIGVSRMAVYASISGLRGFKPRKKAPPRNPAYDDAVIAYRRGDTVRQIADRLGLSWSAVDKGLRRRGVK